MPDYPEEAVTAAVEAVMKSRRLRSQQSAEWARPIVVAALDAAAPVLAEDLREHIDRDHGVMVQIGRIADAAVRMLEHVNMDTPEDRELHARAVGTLRARLDEIAATMKEANEAARPVCSKCGTAGCLEDKALDW